MLKGAVSAGGLDSTAGSLLHNGSWRRDTTAFREAGNKEAEGTASTRSQTASPQTTTERGEQDGGLMREKDGGRERERLRDLKRERERDGDKGIGQHR